MKLYIQIKNEELSHIVPSVDKVFEDFNFFDKFIFKNYSYHLKIEKVYFGAFFPSLIICCNVNFIEQDDSLLMLEDYERDFKDKYLESVTEQILSYMKSINLLEIPSILNLNDYKFKIRYNLNEQLYDCLALKIKEETNKNEFIISKIVNTNEVVAKIKGKDNIDVLKPDIYKNVRLNFYDYPIIEFHFEEKD